MALSEYQPCPKNWEYADVDGYKVQLQTRARQLLLWIWNCSRNDLTSFSKDTRQQHGFFFKDLTPSGFPYFAGNYRGSSNRCLKDYEVVVPGDVRVGHTAATVQMEMDALASRIDGSVAMADLTVSAPSVVFSEPQKLLAYIDVAAALFVYFLEIHPYANGNGHMARTILLAVMARHRLFPQREWNIDPRPSDPPYTNLITKYRNGDREPLIRFIVDSL